MNLSKESRKQAANKYAIIARTAGTMLAAKPKDFNGSNGIILTVNAKLDKITSAEKLNNKAAQAKQMFADYRNKK